MNQNIHCENYTIYYGNFELIYDASYKELSVTKFNQSMVGFKDCPEDRYESHIEWFETYKKEDISKCYYLPKEVIDETIKQGIAYEKHQQEKKREEQIEFDTHPLEEIVFETFKGYSKSRVEKIILNHKKNAKEEYNIDLPGVEYYEKWLNKYCI